MPLDEVGLGLAVPEERERSGLGALGRGLHLGAESILGRDVEAEEREAAFKEATQLRQMASQRLRLFEAGLKALSNAQGNLSESAIDAWATRLEEVAEPLGILAPGSLVTAFRSDSACIKGLSDLIGNSDISKPETEFILNTLKTNPKQCGSVGREIMEDIRKRRRVSDEKQAEIKRKRVEKIPSLFDKFTKPSALEFGKGGDPGVLERRGMNTKEILSARNTILDNATKQAAFELKQSVGIDPSKFQRPDGTIDSVALLAAVLGSADPQAVEDYKTRIQELMEQQLRGLPERDANAIRQGFVQLVKDAEGGKTKPDSRTGVDRDEYNSIVSEFGKAAADRKFRVFGQRQ